MTKPIAIEFSADTRDVVRGAGDIAKAYEDVSDALVDVAKESNKSADQVEDGARDAAKALDKTGDAADDLERRIKGAFRGSADEARKSSQDIGRNAKKGMEEASEGVEALKENTGSNLKEVAASFDGSFEGISDGLQGLLAEMTEGFGPAGLAAGAAIAIGMGIATAAMQDTAEKATEVKQKAVDMASEIMDAGGDIEDLDLGQKIIGWGREVMEDNWITFWVDESSTKFQELAKDARAYGVDFKTAIKATAGDADDSRRFLDATAQSWQDLTAEIDKGRSANEDGTVAFTDAARAAQKKRDALSDLRGQAEENIKITGDAVEITELEKQAIEGTEEATRRATEAQKERADALDDTANAAMDLTSAENAYAEALPQLTKDIIANGEGMDANTEKGRANRDSLVELADASNALRDRAIGAGEGVAQVTARVQAARDSFIEAATKAYGNADAAAALADSYGLIPGNVATQVTANGTEEAKAAIDSIPPATDTTVTVTEQGTAETQAAIDGVKGKEESVKVKEEGAAAVQQTIDSIKGRDVPIRLVISNLGEFNAQVAAATATRTQYVNLVPREGQGVAP